MKSGRFIRENGLYVRHPESVRHDGEGQGTGSCPRTNEISGQEIFNSVDKFIKCHLAGGCSIKHPVGQ